MMQERRRSQRFPIQQTVSISLGNGGHAVSGIVQDISSGGAFVRCNRMLALGSSVDVIIALPPEITHAGSMRALCISRVLRIERRRQEGKIGIALEFLDVQVLPEA
jgi:c-di-GMP-binding flagellar brake protein YcgR